MKAGQRASIAENAASGRGARAVRLEGVGCGGAGGGLLDCESSVIGRLESSRSPFFFFFNCELENQRSRSSFPAEALRLITGTLMLTRQRSLRFTSHRR